MSGAREPTPESAGYADRYDMVVGLEVHVQLRTRTKAFCGCSTDFGAPPNTNVCPICLGLPGALPVLNLRAVELGSRAAMALGCTINQVSVFARKNYFYPDLPKGYQISQYDEPLASDGALEIGHYANGAPIVIGVTRVHMEEDAGKSVHDRYAGATAIDLNRAGVPLAEIVSEPQIRSAAAAGAYLRTLKQILEYTDVSDVSMEEGSLRVDANISVRPHGELSLGTKTEVKNLNSFSAVERALEAEFVRQCALLDAGGEVVQQTMLWDERAGTVRPARGKESSHDYRYFPEPDLLPLVLDPKWCQRVKDSLGELPAKRRARFVVDYGLGPYEVDVLTATSRLADYSEHVARAHRDPRVAANWVMGEVLAAVKSTGRRVEHLAVRPADLAHLLDLVREGTLSGSAAKRVFAIMLETGEPPQQVVAREGLAQVSDDDRLRAWLDEALAAKPDEARRFAAGEKRVKGVLVGAVMKQSGGRADPRRVNELLDERFPG